MTLPDDVKNKTRLLVDDYQSVFGGDLISVILYGSALTTEYDPKKSDLNFLVVLSEEGIERLHLAHGLVAKWRKKKVGTPLFLTKAYIDSSLDTFPIEFLNMRRSHETIFGEDVLAGLSFQKKFVRMQCERELKGKLLLLRERYVESDGKAKDLLKLISASVPTFIFVFKALLYLLDHEVPATKKETVAMISKELNLNVELFPSLLQISAGALKPSRQELHEIFRRYIKQIRRLALRMDSEDFGDFQDSH